MAWSGMMRRGSHRANAKHVQQFAPADWAVVNAFADLRLARSLKCRLPPEIAARAVERFERKAWSRFIEYLVTLPPLPGDDWE